MSLRLDRRGGSAAMTALTRFEVPGASDVARYRSSSQAGSRDRAGFNLVYRTFLEAIVWALKETLRWPRRCWKNGDEPVIESSRTESPNFR